MDTTSVLCPPKSFKVTVRGRGKDCEIVCGIYVPEELTLALIMWIYPQFYSRCNDIVLEKFCSVFSAARHSSSSSSMEEAKPETVEDSCPKDNLHIMSVIQKNEKPDEEYPYYLIRGQKRGYKTALGKITKKYPKSEILSKIEYDPRNSTSPFTRGSKILNFLTRRNNAFKLTGIPVDTFIASLCK